MKKKSFSIFAILLMVLTCTLVFAGCAKGAVPAYTYLKTDTGYVQCSNDKAGELGDHIYLYESEEDASDTANSILSIKFTNGIIDVQKIDVDGNEIKNIVIDISKSVDIIVTVNNSYYSDAKKIYINGEVATVKSVDKSSSTTSLLIQNAKFNSANQNGQINTIEYK